MVNEKIKKSESTLGGLVYSIIIAICVFTGMFLWIQTNNTDSQHNLYQDTVYNDSYTRLSSKQTEMGNTVNDITSAARNVTEAGSAFGVALNGLKGLLAVISLPLKFLDTAKESFILITNPITSLIPDWLRIWIGIGIIAFIIFIIVSIMKGDNNIIR